MQQLSRYELHVPQQLHPRSIHYPMLERPPWRDSALPPTSAMLSEIVECHRQYCALPEAARRWIATAYSRIAAVQWVLSSNTIEGLGTQEEATTEQLVEEYHAQLDRAREAAAATSATLTTPPPPAVSTPSALAAAGVAAASELPSSTLTAADMAIKRRETVQTVAAMSLLYNELQEMKAIEERDRLEHPPAADSDVQCGHNDALLISPDMMCRAHGVLMKGLMYQAVNEQRLRHAGDELTAQSILFPYLGHIYPSGGNVASLLTGVLDEYADNVSLLGDLHTVQYTTQLFMLAA